MAVSRNGAAAFQAAIRAKSEAFASSLRQQTGIEECQTVAGSFEDFMKKIISEEIHL